MTQFFESVMGHRFFEGQVPEFLRELKKLNSNLSNIVVEMRAARGAPAANTDGKETS